MLLDIVEPSLQQEIEHESLIGKTPHGIARLDYHKEMNMKNIIKIGTLAFMASVILAPTTATAQDWRRDKTANEWKTIATISGAIGLLGALNHDDTLTFAGAAGALYSTYRYDQDRRSRDRCDNTRAEYFDHEYFYRDGQRYERKTVWRNGQKYYQFVRCDDSRGNNSYQNRNGYTDEQWRREEKKRIEEDRRYQDKLRREEERRQDEWRRAEKKRIDEERKCQDARRREQEKWDRDHRNDRNRDYDRNRDGRDGRDDRDHDRNRGRGNRSN